MTNTTNYIKHSMITLAAAWIAAILFTPQAMAQSSDSALTTQASPVNPAFPTHRTQQTSIERALLRARPALRSAGTHDAGEGFRQPAMFVDNIFGNNSDNRPAGLRTFQYRLELGADFVTFYDIVLGGFYTYNYEDSEADDFAPALIKNKVHGHYGTLFAAKNFMDWINVGATFTFGYSDIENQFTGPFGFRANTDAWTVAPGVFVGVSHVWNEWGFSSTASYVYEETNFDPRVAGANDFNQSTGTFSWLTTGTYFFTDWLDLTASAKLNQIAHTNVPNPGFGIRNNVNTWATFGLKLSGTVDENWRLSAGIEYDAFNRNYQETVTGTVGAVYNF